MKGLFNISMIHGLWLSSFSFFSLVLYYSSDCFRDVPILGAIPSSGSYFLHPIHLESVAYHV